MPRFGALPRSLQLALVFVTAFCGFKGLASLHMLLVTTVLGIKVGPWATVVAASVDALVPLAALAFLLGYYRGTIAFDWVRLTTVVIAAYELGSAATIHLVTDTRTMSLLDLELEVAVLVGLLAAVARIVIHYAEPNRSMMQ